MRVAMEFHPITPVEVIISHYGRSEKRIDENGRLVYSVVLSTGNKWEVSEDYLIYQGSREGFHSATPFRKQGCEFRVFPNNEVVVYREKYPDFYEQGRVISYQTSYSELKVYERIVQLPQQPALGVVINWEGCPQRVLPYKNVYKEESESITVNEGVI